MTATLAIALFAFSLAMIGFTALTIQMVVTRWWMSKAPRIPSRRPPISILKPLCGVDDDLAANLAQFAQLDYPNFEVVLGVKSVADPAYAVAQDIVRRWPGHVRLVLQRGAPGLNPKVNQLITLVAAARHELLVISDSNVRVPAGYLDEIAAEFEDETVACFTNPVVGVEEQRLGSLLDNLHLGSSIGPGMIAAKLVGGHDIVVGKSMALRRTDLEAMGGFEAARNYLAEDYVIGGRVQAMLGKRVAVGRLPVFNISKNRSVKDFMDRYLRWSVTHRTAIAPTTYFFQGTLNPLPNLIWAFVFCPARWTATALVIGWIWKTALDIITVRQLRPLRLGWTAPFIIALKDLLLAVAWTHGVFSRTVIWRGNRLRVHQGSRLVADDAVVLALPSLPGPVWRSEEPPDRSVA